jgi:hypothetical protein
LRDKQKSKSLLFLSQEQFHQTLDLKRAFGKMRSEAKSELAGIILIFRLCAIDVIQKNLGSGKNKAGYETNWLQR